MYSIFRYVSLVVLVVVSMGCARTQPIYNVEASPVPPMVQKKDVSDKVGSIIAKTALDSGWLVDKTSPGKLHCTLKWREHKAVIDINYSDTNYSIQHVSSENLLDEAGKVHRKYNEQVRKLQDNIDRALSKAANG